MFCTFFKKNKRIYIDRFTAKFWSVFFKMKLQPNPQENTRVRVSLLTKLQAEGKNELRYGCFPVNTSKIFNSLNAKATIKRYFKNRHDVFTEI